MPELLKTFVDKFEKKIKPFLKSRHMPSKTVLILITVFSTLLLLMPLVTEQSFESFGKVCSIAVILATLIDIKADYKVARIVAALKEAHESKSGRRLNRRLKIIKQFFLFYKIKHAIPICFALYFWLYG